MSWSALQDTGCRFFSQPPSTSATTEPAKKISSVSHLERSLGLTFFFTHSVPLIVSFKSEMKQRRKQEDGQARPCFLNPTWKTHCKNTSELCEEASHFCAKTLSSSQSKKDRDQVVCFYFIFLFGLPPPNCVEDHFSHVCKQLRGEESKTRGGYPPSRAFNRLFVSSRIRCPI